MNMNMSNKQSEQCNICNVYHNCFYKMCCVCHKKMVYLWSIDGRTVPLLCYTCLIKNKGAFSRDKSKCITPDYNNVYIGFDGKYHSKNVYYSMVNFVYYPPYMCQYVSQGL